MDLSLLPGHGRPHPLESGVTPLASVHNREAPPVRVTTFGQVGLSSLGWQKSTLYAKSPQVLD